MVLFPGKKVTDQGHYTI